MISVEDSFDCRLALSAFAHSNRRRDDERFIRVFKLSAQCLNHPPILLAVGDVFAEVMVKRCVDNGIRLSSAGPNRHKVSKIRVMNVNSNPRKRRSARLRSCHAQNVMACANKFSRDLRADKAGSAREKNTHLNISVIAVFAISAHYSSC